MMKAHRIRLDGTWLDLLPPAGDAGERRRRWAAWLRLARPVMGHDVRTWAGRQERCCDCQHSRGGWCVAQELPCAFNPVLTPGTGWPGMACMGLGFAPKQLKLQFTDRG